MSVYFYCDCVGGSTLKNRKIYLFKKHIMQVIQQTLSIHAILQTGNPLIVSRQQLWILGICIQHILVNFAFKIAVVEESCEICLLIFKILIFEANVLHVCIKCYPYCIAQINMYKQKYTDWTSKSVDLKLQSFLPTNIKEHLQGIVLMKQHYT